MPKGGAKDCTAATPWVFLSPGAAAGPGAVRECGKECESQIGLCSAVPSKGNPDPLL